MTKTTNNDPPNNKKNGKHWFLNPVEAIFNQS